MVGVVGAPASCVGHHGPVWGAAAARSSAADGGSPPLEGGASLVAVHRWSRSGDRCSRVGGVVGARRDRQEHPAFAHIPRPPDRQGSRSSRSLQHVGGGDPNTSGSGCGDHDLGGADHGHRLEPEKAKSQSPRYLDALLLASLRWFALTLGIADHQVRYFTPAVPFLALGAAPGLVWLGSRLPRRLFIGAGGLTLLMGLAVAIPTVRENGAPCRKRGGGLGVERRLSWRRWRQNPASFCPTNLSNGWYSGCETALFPVERRWVDGDPRASGIGDRDRMLMKLRSQMRKVTADGADPEIYVVASDPPLSQEPMGAARKLLMDLVVAEAVSVRDLDATVRIFGLGSAGRVLAELMNSQKEVSG